jgi:hypothetical protein
MPSPFQGYPDCMYYVQKRSSTPEKWRFAGRRITEIQPLANVRLKCTRYPKNSL